MQTNRFFLLLSLIIFMICGLNLSAHGIFVKIINLKEVAVIKVNYSGDMEVVNAYVEIFYEAGDLFQQGRTDKNGIFCFQPDSIGYYTVVVDDEMGHKKSLKINISNDFFNKKTSHQASQTEHSDKSQNLRESLGEEKEGKGLDVFKVLFGITFILLITIILFLLKKK